MTGILIIAHAPLASALKACAHHTFPECAATLETLDVQPDASPEETETQARALLERVLQPEALILTDVFGATPCNVAQRLADGVQVKVVSGVNVPMLWRTLCYQHESLDMVLTRALAGATQGVMQVATARPQNQAQKPGHDPAHHQDQQ
ncbi:PTS sugar transporter subunit IIA [Caldimonas tepidiphila]|uniref:PTS sugar transporter subunit IIA n=1 Tax=Caldimonas tepidiphila TaxID=2315841 RepID=UPI000E5A6A6F|nr:PTS fructose transporter subunit IIA [Caldimonas tepidiphila]